MSNPFSPPIPNKPGEKFQWGNLLGCSSAFTSASAALDHGETTLVIAPDMNEADRITRDIKLFLHEQPNAPDVTHFADWETLPYDNFSPHQDIISDRVRCLYQLVNGGKNLVVVSAKTLLQRLAPELFVLQKSLCLKIGETLHREAFRERLVNSGYNLVDTVYQHGEFALRGALIDIYPMGTTSACRIELFDNEVESLREFDPETQRTIQHVKSIDILPGKEYPLDDEGIAHFKSQWHEHFDTDAKSCPLYQDVTSGIAPAGIEYYLPLFFEETASLLDYLPESTLVIIYEGFENAMEGFWREAQQRYESRAGDRLRPILNPLNVFHPVDQIFSKIGRHRRINITETRTEEKQGRYNFDLQTPPIIRIDNQSNSTPLHRLEAFIHETNKNILLCAESNGRKEAIKELLEKIDILPDEYPSIHAFLNAPNSIGITVADIDQGMNCEYPKVIIFAESQIFNERIQQRRRRKDQNDNSDAIVKSLAELKTGSPVVHIDHGVGRYLGLESIKHDDMIDEFLVLQYADDAKLYVPVTNLHLISRYSGAEDSQVPLNKLGSEQWSKAKRKAVEKIRDVAAELLDIYAQRQARTGFTYENPKEAYTRFANGFPFEETPDQEAAIIAVRDDMLSSQPMDRLVCGDVGFGKTEVAMRAAFIAVQNGKQVAVLVPTTLLAQQHHNNFKDRFADWPVNVEVISRFQSAKQISEIQKQITAGAIDIIIGTHKLIQGDIKYHNLGLVIIDEEHRFGVRQKESLKSLRAEIDILTMTATPIPRTLNMSMSGIRDLSIIATPPAKRLSVKTFVRETDTNLIKEAILREILRGGQVYFLHNEVKTIEKTARDIEEMIPEARVQIGHGQMRERELEAVMSDFYHKRFNVLVCTTIIETGIDVPSANTIIIDRADRFGLAQLHQLRGRVGRSHHQAYAYLMTPHPKAMTADAVKRLEAIAEAQDLGAGFTLASHDLEIRGAGELLGEEQSGQIQTIGFSLYMEMLDRAVKTIQSGGEIDMEMPLPSGVEMNLRIPALIPDDYLPDVHTRLILYKRLSSVTNEEELNDLQVEMIDRFGLLPDATKNLIRQTRIRFAAERLGITKVEASGEKGRLEFANSTQVDPLSLVQLVQKQPQHYRLEGANQLKFNFDMDSHDARLKTVHNVINSLKTAS